MIPIRQNTRLCMYDRNSELRSHNIHRKLACFPSFDTDTLIGTFVIPPMSKPLFRDGYLKLVFIAGVRSVLWRDLLTLHLLVMIVSVVAFI